MLGNTIIIQLLSKEKNLKTIVCISKVLFQTDLYRKVLWTGLCKIGKECLEYFMFKAWKDH